jgi:hypothetical protein
MGLRQMLPVQTKRTYFTITERGGGGVRQGKFKRLQVNELNRGGAPEKSRIAPA